LSEQEAKRRLEEFGPNEPLATKHHAVVVEILRRFTNPLVAILVMASVASAIVRDFVNAAIVVTIVMLSVVVEFVQTHRSQRAAEVLTARVAQTATVLRDGTWREISRRLVVPGDVVRVAAGDMVPADARLFEAKDLHVSEAALTGESLPVEKTIPDASALLMGSSVVSGTGTALVTLTGSKTAFGGIAQTLAARPPPSEFERGTARFSIFILKTVLFLVLFVFVATAALRKDPLESLLFAVALAVGLTPEFLPMIVTVTLTRGAVRMADAKVIVKNLAAIQNFGSMDILCSDKTGTLTTGEMTLERHVNPLGEDSERPLLLGYVNSYFQSGIDNPLDQAVLQKAKLNPLDSAVLRHDHPDISGYTKVDEIPFDFERRRVSIVAKRDGETIVVTKGAPEHVLAVCTTYEVQDTTRALDADTRARCAATFEELGAKGYRVLAVAYARVGKCTLFSKEDECHLVLAGFLAFVDPPRDDARLVLSELRKEGVQVKVITGDSELVAAHVCECVGIGTKHLLRGSEIDKMSDPALAHRAERTHVFARVTPAQKSRILRALHSRGHVVGFLGDGINDAPSLHSADVGISVSSAADVAKDAANIVLLEPGLRVLLKGVLEGRRAFGNVMKYLLMGTSSNFGNMFSMAGAAVLLPFLPMLPTQILLNNFLYDLAQITIPSDNVDARFVRKPRRWNIDLIRRFMLVIGPVSSLYDFLTFYVLLKVFHASEALFHTGWFVESLATQTLVIFVIRTASSPFRSRPSRALIITTLGVVGLAVALPYLPGATLFGFVPLPGAFFAFLLVATVTYLVLVELVKRMLFRRALA
jgi:Mg2+-importing ATPase